MPRRSRDEEEGYEDDRGEYMPKRSAGRPPEPVRGEIVGTSELKLVGLLLVGLVFLVVCGFFLFDGIFIGDSKTFLPFRLTWWGYILAAVGLLAGLFCPVAALLGFLRPTQLVFGKRMFQEQRKSGEGWVVILQIPYANIRKVKVETFGDDTKVAFRFRDTGDDDTFIGDETAPAEAEKKGWDYLLDGLYTKSLKQIAADLDDRAREVDDDV